MNSPLFLPMIALSMEVLVEITHKSAVVLETKERDTRSMKPASGQKKLGRIIFKREPRRLKKTAFTATRSPFLPPRPAGWGAAGRPAGCWFLYLETIAASTARALMMATGLAFVCSFDRAPILLQNKEEEGRGWGATGTRRCELMAQGWCDAPVTPPTQVFVVKFKIYTNLSLSWHFCPLE